MPLVKSCKSVVFGEGDGTPLQYSCLENPMDRGACQTAVHGVAKSRTRLSDLTFTFHFLSSILTWKIPWTVEPGRLQLMGSQRVGHNLAPEYTHEINRF